LFESEGRHTDVAQVLADKARLLEDDRERAGLYRRIGEIKAGALADLDGAAEAYRDALDVDPGDIGTLQALASIEERRGDFVAFEELLRRRVDVVPAAERVTLLFELVRNATGKLDDPERALGFLNEIVAIDPENRSAYDEIARILSNLERWHDLCDVLSQRADLEERAGDVRAEEAARLAMAEIWASRLGAPDAALEAVEKVLSRRHDNPQALLAMAKIHEAREAWDDAVAVLDRAAVAASSDAETAEIRFRMGKLVRAKGEHPEGAEAHFLAVIAIDAGHAGTLAELESLARASQDQDRLVQVLELRERIATDDAGRRALLTEIAQLYSGPLGDAAAALAPLERLAGLAPTDLAVQESLGTALIGTGRLDEGERILVRVVEQLSRSKQNKAVARLQHTLGTLSLARGDLASAEQRFGAAWEIDPGQAAVLAALARLAEQRKDVEKARRFYRSLLLQTFDEKTAGITKAEIYLALGRLHVIAGELPKARNMFERGLEGDPHHAELKRALAELPR
jgi:tetratricopeptide (TPR) repeat protein